MQKHFLAHTAMMQKEIIAHTVIGCKNTWGKPPEKKN